MNSHFKKGIIFALFTALISGLSIFYNKLVVTTGFDSSIFNVIKNGGVALILSGLLLFSKRRKNFSTLSLKQWCQLGLIGVIGGGIPFILYFEGLKSVSAINANIIHKSMFIWVAALAIPFLSERLNVWQIIGFAIIAWSNLFIGGFTGFTGNSGEIMILSATLLWAVENIIAKNVLKEIDDQIVAWGRMTLGLIVLLMAIILQNKVSLFYAIKFEQILPVLGSIVFLTFYVTTWYKALKFAPATIVTSVLIIATPITNLLTAIFITHTLPSFQLINIIATTIGIFLISFFTLRYTGKKIISSSC